MVDRKILIGFTLILGFMTARHQMSAAHTEKRVELIVFAASSLADAFQAVGRDFDAANQDIHVTYNFAGSQQLLQQIVHGAPVDVFASASRKQIDAEVASGQIDSSSVKIFARNRLVVIVPKKNDAGLKSLHDLARPNLKIVLADKAVPAGQYTVEFLDRFSRGRSADKQFKEDVLKNVVSYEENVRAVLSKVVIGEADAGIVYTSDISRDTAHRIDRISIPDSLNVIGDYPIALSKNAKHRDAAQRFVEYILSANGQATLSEFGLLPAAAPAKR